MTTQFRSPIQIWFLDADLQKSAEYLSNEYLYRSIKGCQQSLITAIFYYIGIRNKKFYKFFFSKTKKDQTMEQFFPMWPFEKPPIFSNYTARQAKWTRKCLEHFNYIKDYLNILCQEYEFRYKKQSSAQKFLDWLEINQIIYKIPSGHINNITLEWKCLEKKFRQKNIINGYRAQYKALLTNYGIKIEDFHHRDIPEFLLDNTRNESMKKWME